VERQKSWNAGHQKEIIKKKGPSTISPLDDEKKRGQSPFCGVPAGKKLNRNESKGPNATVSQGQSVVRDGRQLDLDEGLGRWKLKPWRRATSVYVNLPSRQHHPGESRDRTSREVKSSSNRKLQEKRQQKTSKRKHAEPSAGFTAGFETLHTVRIPRLHKVNEGEKWEKTGIPGRQGRETSDGGETVRSSSAGTALENSSLNDCRKEEKAEEREIRGGI